MPTSLPSTGSHSTGRGALDVEYNEELQLGSLGQRSEDGGKLEKGGGNVSGFVRTAESKKRETISIEKEVEDRTTCYVTGSDSRQNDVKTGEGAVLGIEILPVSPFHFRLLSRYRVQ